MPAPNERNAVNTLLNGMMFIVLGDDTVFNRARTSVQKNRYQTEEFDDLEEKMTVDIDHSGEKDDAAKKHGITLKRTGSTTVNATGSRKNLKKYLTHHHGGDKKDAADVHKGVFKEEQIAMRMAIEEDKDWPRPFTKSERSEFMRPKEKSAEETKAIKDRMKEKNKSRPKGVQEEEQLDEYGAMSKDKESHDTGGFRISNKDASAAKERAKKKSAEKRDKLSNIIKKNTIQKGPMKGYMTDEVNQGEEKMDIDWTKNPFAQAKAMKEGAFKKQATADAEEERLKAEKKAKRLSDKKGKDEKETDPGLKEGLLQEGGA